MTSFGHSGKKKVVNVYFLKIYSNIYHSTKNQFKLNIQLFIYFSTCELSLELKLHVAKKMSKFLKDFFYSF